MRKASVRDLHIRTSELVREAAQGSVIIIERRGEPIAELRPLSAASQMPPAKKAKIFASMQRLWNKMPQLEDSTRLIGEDRGR